jgi:hypothetical protein
MHAIVLVALIALFAIVAAVPVKFTLCQENPPFTITAIDVTPGDVVKPGQTITAKISGVSKVTVKGGTLLSDISLDDVSSIVIDLTYYRSLLLKQSSTSAR